MLIDAWLALFPADRAAGERLIEMWSEPHRRYHTVHHLEFMLSIVDQYEHEADDPRLVRRRAGSTTACTTRSGPTTRSKAPLWPPRCSASVAYPTMTSPR